MKINLINKKLILTEAKIYGSLFMDLVNCPTKGFIKNNVFTCDANALNCLYLNNLLPQARWVGEAEIFKYECLASQKQEQELKKAKENIIVGSYPEVFKTKPFEHQLKAFEASKLAKAYGYFFEQGCGKTKVTIDVATYLFLNNHINTLIIIAPNGVHKNWITSELPVHCNIPYIDFCWEGVENKKTKKRLEELEKSREMKVYSFNIECFVSKNRVKMLNDLLSKNNCLMVIDESQGIKNPSAVRTKVLLEAGRKSKFRRILSGTPITKGMEDIYSQLYFLDPNILGLHNFYAFKARYCEIVKRQNPYAKSDSKVQTFEKIVGYKRVDELQEKMKNFSYRVLKTDCLDLPPKLYQQERFTLTDQQLALITQIKQEGLALIRNKNELDAITVSNVLSKLTKIQQIASGFVIDTENNKKIIELMDLDKNPRIIRLNEITERITTGKMIVWARFTKDIDNIIKLLGDKAVRYDGLVDTNQKEEAKVRFQKDDKIKYFVAKPIKGLTLTEGITSVYYSNDFDLEKRLQSEDRPHRIGIKEVAQKYGVDSILYIDLIAEGSIIDDRILKSFKTKKSIADMVLEDPQSIFL